jgi:hypothetical protein
MISVIGGVYGEQCASPRWNAVFGSGGSAAACLSTKCDVTLQTIISPEVKSHFDPVLRAYNFTFVPDFRQYDITFRYLNPMILREIIHDNDCNDFGSIKLRDTNVLVFGMMNCSFVVHAEKAVYDPQGEVGYTDARKFFSTTGSTAIELVYVLNDTELRALSSKEDIYEAANFIISQ